MSRCKTLQNTQNYTIGPTAGIVLGSNPRRCAIILSPVVGGGASVLSLSFRQDVAAGQGMFNFVAGVSYLVILTDGDVGDIITAEWSAVVDAGSMTVQITEIMYMEGCGQ